MSARSLEEVVNMAKLKGEGSTVDDPVVAHFHDVDAITATCLHGWADVPTRLAKGFPFGALTWLLMYEHLGV
jgi:hypothetical protein